MLRHYPDLDDRAIAELMGISPSGVRTAGGPANEASPEPDRGARLLVSGEPRWGGLGTTDAIAWGCGVTRRYDARTAEAWRAAVSAR